MNNNNYIKRSISDRIKYLSDSFPVIVLTGPRQSGKSTLLQNLFPHYKYITFDNPVIKEQVLDDPGLFVESLTEKTILDEIQYVPNILPYLKIIVDSNRGSGNHFILTGSQPFTMISGLVETLAGRAVILELLPFSLNEFNNQAVIRMSDLFEYIYKGFYPDTAIHKYPINEYYGVVTK